MLTPLPEPKRRNISLAMKTEPNRVVSAIVIGPFGVHKSLIHLLAGYYSVSHVPTGCRFPFDFPSRDEAVAFAYLLLASDLDWSDGNARDRSLYSNRQDASDTAKSALRHVQSILDRLKEVA